MNDPPTSLVGFKKSTLRFLLVGRYERSTNFVGGIQEKHAAVFVCRPCMNDPPTSLVGFTELR